MIQTETISFGSALNLDFSLDARSLAVAESALRVWDVATGRQMTPPLEHLSKVRSVRFDDRGRRLLTASSDSTVRIWHLSPDPRPLESLAVHARVLANRQLSPPGRSPR